MQDHLPVPRVGGTLNASLALIAVLDGMANGKHHPQLLRPLQRGVYADSPRCCVEGCPLVHTPCQHQGARSDPTYIPHHQGVKAVNKTQKEAPAVAKEFVAALA